MTQTPEADAWADVIQTDAKTVQTGAKEWSFILDYPRPPKGLSANDRPGHWSIKHGATQDVRTDVFVKTRALRLGVLDAIRVDVVWVVADRRRRDTDNAAPFLKAIYDGIGADKGVSAHLVDDDDPAHMYKAPLTIRYEKGVRPHFEVSIQPWGGPDEVTF